MSEKINLRGLIGAHLATFKGYPLRTTLFDLGTFVFAPIAIGVASTLWAPPIYSIAVLLSGVAVFSGLLVALMVNVFNFSVKLRRDENLGPEHPLVRSVNELMANSVWAVLVGLSLTILTALASATSAPDCALNAVWVGLIAAVFAHLGATILQVITRIWSAHELIGNLSPKDKSP